MTFQCWVLRRWVFEAYYRQYPTRNLELGIPAAGYSRCWVFHTRTKYQKIYSFKGLLYIVDSRFVDISYLTTVYVKINSTYR